RNGGLPQDLTEHACVMAALTSSHTLPSTILAETSACVAAGAAVPERERRRMARAPRGTLDAVGILQVARHDHGATRLQANRGLAEEVPVGYAIRVEKGLRRPVHDEPRNRPKQHIELDRRKYFGGHGAHHAQHEHRL